jgi:hypothetical protein
MLRTSSRGARIVYVAAGSAIREVKLTDRMWEMNEEQLRARRYFSGVNLSEPGGKRREETV